ncbi:hypothetical protein WOLCODRAFT_91813 [Wolfiporia cocos MD-104 SS10]|uniref:RNA-dependent RNA polymerase n=1 Tax=Wolfiporia cocos (strain MD-104) TaxID=742152 RepID=A0A2H3J1J4_WOLCO|nr:hypothetical protein WOLCODRAFT_91813 [Wolfiporia cocos MD-104 SS10]
MEIFMHNIGYRTTQHQLKIELANILHSPAYSPPSEPPINFDVCIYTQNRSRGSLILPWEEIGERFMNEFGGCTARRSIIIGTTIIFERNWRQPNDGIVENIRRLPYVDPRAAEEAENRSREARRMSVSINLIQFGWICRDSVFSTEWERPCFPRGTLILDYHKREFRIQIPDAQIMRVVAVRAAQIYSTCAGTDERHRAAIFLLLHHPPSFETIPRGYSRDFLESPAPLPIRRRWPSFDESHEPVAPHTSLAIHLVCNTRDDLETYRRLCELVNKRVGGNLSVYSTQNRTLFHRSVREEYKAWIQTLPWEVAFQVEALLYSHVVDMRELLTFRARIERMAESGAKGASIVLRGFVARAKQGDDIFDCLHVVITPTTMSLAGPLPTRSNRVIRRYLEHQDSFLRVSFVDENHLTYRFDRDLDIRDFVNRRVKGFLTRGLDIAGCHFEFLAYSQSALKEHAVWFVKPFVHGGCEVNAASIIESLGSFKNLASDPNLIYCPARYAARISQAFSSTEPSVSVRADEVMYLQDVTDGGDPPRYCFTDGVGTISSELAKEIYGGEGDGRAIGIRPSMLKFDAPNSLEIEIARAFDRPGKYYLNRPLIMLLEGIGVPAEVFQSLQDDAVHETQDAVHSLDTSARLLETNGLGSSFRLSSTFLKLHRLGVAPLHEDIFWSQMMCLAVGHVLREIKHRARIPVPNGWTLVGVADVHGWLREGEIFACVDSQDQLKYLEGPVMISRSPVIHPGDVQVVRAVGKPPPGSPFEREPLRNSVVFSIKGERPLFSCLAGGDLDGDEYNVTTATTLIPPYTYEPAAYDSAQKKLVNHESTMEDVADFIAEYITSDTVGIIANRWRIIADQSSHGVFDRKCYRLAKLHSDAVDYPKSGTPVAHHLIPDQLFSAKPDWSAPETISPNAVDYYPSPRAIGHLFRAIKLPVIRMDKRVQEDIGLVDVLTRYRTGAEVDHGGQVYIVVKRLIAEVINLPETTTVADTAITRLWELFESYASRLRTICADHTLSHSRTPMLTEEEAVLGTIIEKCSQPRERRNLISRLREQTSTLVNIAYDELLHIAGSSSALSVLEQAWIAYQIALCAGDRFGARSFGWVVLNLVLEKADMIRKETHDSKISR